MTNVAIKPKQSKQRRNIKSEKTALYRAYSEKGELLYVGISLSVFSRLSNHSSSSDWFNLASEVTVEWHPDRNTALDAESTAIRIEYPVFNKAGAVAKPVKGRVYGWGWDGREDGFVNAPSQCFSRFISNLKLHERLVGRWLKKSKEEPSLIMSMLYRRKAELNIPAYREICRRRWPPHWHDQGVPVESRL
jgi:hypothetical protein